jgi:hypothetical protein
VRDTKEDQLQIEISELIQGPGAVAGKKCRVLMANPINEKILKGSLRRLKEFFPHMTFKYS